MGETVTVDSAPPLLETDRASVSTDLTSQQVESLPILDRNFTELELLLPGAAKMPWQHGQTENPQGGIQVNTNGQLFSGTNFMIDGMDNNDPVLGIVIINPPIDSVQGFNATTSNFDAEFSQAGGVVIQVETKSGTNQIHGSGFEFFRNNIFQARDPTGINLAGLLVVRYARIICSTFSTTRDRGSTILVQLQSVYRLRPSAPGTCMI
ncbi:MAG: hypothetical protein DMG70_05415 [Acidobacteria bacterium]|nr:MAG: hypothetical protein DMG70_05415 [Acidobacteriota bacterium]